MSDPCIVTESPTAPPQRVEPVDPIASRLNERQLAIRRLTLWATSHNRVLTIMAASIAPILYLAFINHYATNSFFSDDWSVVPTVHAALHGHLSLSQLWSQHNESRLLIGNVLDVLAGSIDNLDLRSMMFLSAAALIGSYAGLLILLRRNLGQRLTPIPVLVIGVIWFSLADVQNALWAFQVSWYLTVFFFVLMLIVLFVPTKHRVLWFAVAALLACTASLTTLQGFACWPVGAICILWNQYRPGRARSEIAVWLGAMAVTLALYLPGYSFGLGNTCPNRASCSSAVILHHPLTALGFFFALIGNVVPGETGAGGTVHGVARFEVLGIALFAAAVFVLLQSWRHRATTEQQPLPLLLIVFALLFDGLISVGRSGTGPAGAVVNDRFVMANLILLTGIVIYAWAYLPAQLKLCRASDSRSCDLPCPLSPSGSPRRPGDDGDRFRFKERSCHQKWKATRGANSRERPAQLCAEQGTCLSNCS